MAKNVNNQYQKQYQGNPNIFGRTAVLYGGVSQEREVSLQSGMAIIESLQNSDIDVVGIDVGDNPVRQILGASPDRVFIALHGAAGEDGKIQSVLKLLGIPFTGSEHAASAIAMNKLTSKLIWSSLNLPTPIYKVLTSTSDFKHVFNALGEVVVKPANEGSSIGMGCAKNAEELEDAFNIAANFDTQVFAEKRIKGREFTVAILNDIALPPVELKTDHEFYDYEAKYISDTTEYLCPCGLSIELETIIKTLALNAFHAVGGIGWGRVDFMANCLLENSLKDSQGFSLEKNNPFWLLEVNTVPGMTGHSLVPIAAKQAGLSFNELVLEILQTTL